MELVRKVGIELRALLSSVDALMDILPISAHREVEMAHKVLSKDMAELVTAMKQAQKYSATTLDVEYRKYVFNNYVIVNYHALQGKVINNTGMFSEECCQQHTF